jgi:hypothetical protein
LLIAPARTLADAIVRTQAMLAGTIAEYFVEEDRVRVALEIGVADLEAFANLLPDELYEKLYQPLRPYAERLADFFERDFAIAADAGARLPGRLVGLEGRTRLRRDPISGEPLPNPAGEEPEPVLFAQLEYALEQRPASLTLFGPRGPSQASVGFVVYHGDIAVNDFRYLSPAQTLELDWNDPWYTRFERRALRRQYYAPMSGFLYVEPYEVRKEIIARPIDLQQWVDLGLAGRSTIPAELQPELRRRAAEFLRAHHPVTIDGERIEPELARVHFLERTLKSSRVIDPPVDLSVHSAVLGVIFVYPTDGMPQQVTMNWDLWGARAERIPVAAVDPAGPLPSYLERDWRVLEWTNFLKNPVLPTLAVLEAPPRAAARALWSLRWVLLAAMGVAALWAVHEIVSGLLHNVYRAFDFRNEERIFDALDRSAEGALLERLFLETRRGLELASQGGARAKVKQIELLALDAEPADGGGFVARATWNVAGSVGHWGHVHQRRNQYRAELAVAPRDGTWKLVDVEILEEQRL